MYTCLWSYIYQQLIHTSITNSQYADNFVVCAYLAEELQITFDCFYEAYEMLELSTLWKPRYFTDLSQAKQLIIHIL